MKEYNLTLCDANLVGDIPTYKLKTRKESGEVLEKWFDLEDRDERVFVCFQSWGLLADSIYELKITSSIDMVWDYCLSTLDQFDEGRFLESLETRKVLTKIDYNIFEFYTWEDALKYCYDLKHG